MSYINLDARKIDEKQSNKGNSIQQIILCKCEKYVSLNSSPYLEESAGIDLDETNEEVSISGNAEAEVENDCEVDHYNSDTTRIYEVTDIPSYVTCIHH